MFTEAGVFLQKSIVDFKLPIDVVHYIVSALSVRQEAGSDFALQQPLASWLCSLLAAFSGTFLTNFLLGESLLEPLLNKSNLILFTLIWYHISILDSIASIFSWKPLNAALTLVKELRRNQKVMDGVALGTARFPELALMQVLLGFTKANGTSAVKIVQQFVRGKWAPEQNEALRPSATTKAAGLTAMLYASRSMPHEIAYLCGACILVGSKLLTLTGVPHSPLDQPFARLRFMLIDTPRLLESCIFGGRAEEVCADEATVFARSEDECGIATAASSTMSDAAALKWERSVRQVEELLLVQQQQQLIELRSSSEKESTVADGEKKLCSAVDQAKEGKARKKASVKQNKARR